jgi:hypothetical protein
MANGSQSPTPEKTGNNKSAANAPNDKGKADPKQKIKPGNRQIKKWFSLTKTQWKELLGYMILIPWLWYDLLDSHGFLKLCLLAASLAFAQGLVVSFLKSRWKAIALWLVSLMPVAIIVCENSKPESKPFPFFSLSVRTEEMASIEIPLTNDFLIPTLGNGVPEIWGNLFIPTDGKSLTHLMLGIKNNSSTLAEDVDFLISLPARWQCGEGQGWLRAQNNTINADILYSSNDPVQSWAYPFAAPILPGDGIQIPFISLFPDVSPPSDKPDVVCIMVRAKDIPVSAMKEICFRLTFIPTNHFDKPFLIKAEKIKPGVFVTFLPTNPFSR